jgi:hypothetical protein
MARCHILALIYQSVPPIKAYGVDERDPAILMHIQIPSRFQKRKKTLREDDKKSS